MEPLIESFLDVHPNTSTQIFSCQPPEGIQDLSVGKTDILLYMASTKVDEYIRYVPYTSEKLSVACMCDHPLAQYDSLLLEQIRGESITSFKFDGNFFTDYNQHLLELLSKRGIYPKEFSISQQVDTVGLSLKKNGGVCLLPYGIRHMDRYYLKFIPLRDEDCLIDMCLYYRTDNDNPLIPQFVKTALTHNVG